MILVLKMTKKYHITWYWCQNIRDNMVEKRVKKLGQGPPPFRAMPERNRFFLWEVFPYPSPQAGDVVASQLQAQHCRWEGPRTSRRSGGWENKWWWLGKQMGMVQKYQDLLLFTCSLLSSFCFCSVMSSSFSCFEPRRVRAVNEYEYLPMLNIKISKYKNTKIQKYKNTKIQ